MQVKLMSLAQVIRSKNSGPYELTLDIIFKEWADFEEVCASKQINAKWISALYNIREEDVINIIEFKPAKAIKATIVRPLASGELGETDVYGAQQHAPLLGVSLEMND